MLREHVEHLRLDVDRVDAALRADTAGEFERVEAIPAAHVADALAGFDGERLQQQSAVFLPLATVTDEPGSAGEVHRAGDLTAAMMGSRGRDRDRPVDRHVDG